MVKESAKLVKVRTPFRATRYAWEWEGRRIMLGNVKSAYPFPVGAVCLESGKCLDLKTGEVY